MKINQSYLKLNKLTDLLKSLNVPMQSLTQFHLEVILQIEGKSVLSFFLNQKTYLNLSDGDSKCFVFNFIYIIYFRTST